MNCQKCGNKDISTQYRATGEQYKGDKAGDFVKVTYEGYYITYVKEEHLACTCKTCGYFWREDTLDNVERKKKEAKQALLEKGFIK